MADRLLPLLPSVIRGEGSPNDPLGKTLAAFEDALALIEAAISKGYDNNFIETCDPRLLPYLGDLIGYQSVLAAGYDGSTDDAADAGNLRRDIARTIWLRRRKGTPAAAPAAVKAASGWHSVLFENSRNVVTAASVRLPGQVAGRSLPDFRRFARMNNTRNLPPETLARVATLRRIDRHGERGRWHPQDVVLEAWPRRAYRMQDVTPAKVANTSFRTFSPIGLDTQLYGPADTGTCSPVLVSAAPIQLHTVAGRAVRSPRIYGADRAVAVMVDGGEGFGPLEAKWVRFGMVRAGQDPSTDGTWVIDPDSGRILPPAGAPEFRVRYYYEFGGDIGGGAYRQGIAHPANTVIADSDTYTWAILAKAGAQDRSSTRVVARALERPTVLIDDFVFNTATVELDGLLLVGAKLGVGPDVSLLVLRDCTVVDSTGTPSPIAFEAGRDVQVSVERSVFGGMSTADRSRVRLDRISDCIVQTRQDPLWLEEWRTKFVNSTVLGDAPLVVPETMQVNSTVPGRGDVPPKFQSERYGTVGYAQPVRGGGDASRETGAFRSVSTAWLHEAMNKRLAEYVPLEARAGIILSTQ